MPERSAGVGGQGSGAPGAGQSSFRNFLVNQVFEGGPWKPPVP